MTFKNKLKIIVKEFLEKPTAEGLQKVFSYLDKTQKKNLFHHNKVARLKSNYSKKVGKEVEVKKKLVKKKVAKKMS